MANTERLAVLAKVRTAKKGINQLLNDASLGDADRAVLEESLVDLDGVEDELILAELRERVEHLKSVSSDLAKKARRMRKSIKKIQKVADLVDDAAQAIKVLVKIATTVAAAGL